MIEQSGRASLLPGSRAGCRQCLARDQICILGQRPSRQRAVVVDGHAPPGAGVTAGNASRGIIFGLCSTRLGSPARIANEIASAHALAAFRSTSVSVGHFSRNLAAC